MHPQLFLLIGLRRMGICPTYIWWYTPPKLFFSSVEVFACRIPDTSLVWTPLRSSSEFAFSSSKVTDGRDLYSGGDAEPMIPRRPPLIRSAGIARRCT